MIGNKKEKVDRQSGFFLLAFNVLKKKKLREKIKFNIFSAQVTKKIRNRLQKVILVNIQI